MRKWFKQHLFQPEKLRGSIAHTVLGERLLCPSIWRITRRSLSGGLALGLFIAFTPTVPFHTLLAAIGALYFRVNLPIAILASWIMNPVTAIPIFSAGLGLGHYIYKWWPTFIGMDELEGRLGSFVRQTVQLWIGCLTIATFAAVTGNLLVRAAWRYSTNRAWRRRSHPAAQPRNS